MKFSYYSVPGRISSNAVLESTGEIIKKHFDNVGKYIPLEYKHLPFHNLSYNEINWKLAGYKV